MDLAMTKTKFYSGTWSEQWHFLRRLIANPRRVGAVAPSSSGLAQAMVSQIERTRSGPVLELGPGSGVVTQELIKQGFSPSRLTVVERDPAFVKIMTERFPDINVVQGDAFHLGQLIDTQNAPKFSAVISGLPLLNFPPDKRKMLLQSILSHLEPGAPFIQFSYGWYSPVPVSASVAANHAAFVWKNIPPAHVWVYRRASGL